MRWSYSPRTRWYFGPPALGQLPGELFCTYSQSELQYDPYALRKLAPSPILPVTAPGLFSRVPLFALLVES